MITEEEAKKRWCPFADDLDLVEGYNRANHNAADNRCIASQCMTWRWHVRPNGDKGYCGLAGEKGEKWVGPDND